MYNIAYYCFYKVTDLNVMLCKETNRQKMDNRVKLETHMYSDPAESGGPGSYLSITKYLCPKDDLVLS